jgi:hypothetical protein
VTGAVHAGRLTLTWTFSDHLHTADSATAIAGRAESALLEMAALCPARDIDPMGAEA